MTPTHIVIVTFDNTDPQAFGPFTNAPDADAAQALVEARLPESMRRHIENVSTTRLQAVAK